MDGRQFVKLLKDCGILDKKFTTTDIDIIFAKVKEKKERVIDYETFLNALQLCANSKGTSEENLHEIILKSNGPLFSGTNSDNVRFHDDKDQYTGVYKQGGPDNTGI